MKSPRLASNFVLASLCVLAGCGSGGGGSTPTVPAAGPTSTPIAAPTPTTAPTSTPTPAAIPAAFATMVPILQADISAFSNGVNAACPGTYTSASPTRFDLELLSANANHLVSVLPGMSVAQAQTLAANAVQFAVGARRLLPNIGFMVNPNYPVMVQNQANAPSWWNTAQNYSVFQAYYAALAQGLSSNGIPFDVETNLVFPAYTGAGQNYSGLSAPQLATGVAEDTSNVLTTMANAQYVNVASEPLTLSQNTGNPTFNTVTGYQAYVASVRSQIVVPNGNTAKLGAGSADWSDIAFLNAIKATASLGFNDLHLYPPDLLAQPGGGITQIEAISPSVTGRPGIITENWDEKDAGGMYSGAADAQTLEATNTYSFWAPYDAQYIPAMVKFARCQNLAVTSFWYENELFAYLDYTTASQLTPQAAQGAVGQAAAANVAAGKLSPSGAALYTALTGQAAPMSVRRR